MISSFDNRRGGTTQRDRRMQALCGALLALPAHLSEWGMDKAAREAARSLCEFFDREIDLHRNEQEARVFPALLARVHDRDIAAVRGLVAHFTAEHRTLEQAWEKLRPRLAAIGFCRPARLSSNEATRFATLYRNHMAGEHRHLFE
jgi:pyridoxamine 5'-phosphate oxidase